MNRTACADKAKISHTREKVCQLGCSKVRETIKQIEQGLIPEPSKILNEQECRHLSNELKAIMQACS